MGLAGALVCLGVETLVSADRTLRALDRAFLERWVQADALAVSAIGIAGAELPALADQVAAQRVDMAAMIAVLRESLRSVDGTAWFAVVPGEADQRQGFLIPTPTAPRQFTAERKQRGSREEAESAEGSASACTRGPNTSAAIFSAPSAPSAV